MSDSIAGRALRGGVALGVRQVLVHGANLLGVVALARALDAAAFGTVTIALFVQGALVSVCALGLGASLVRELDEPSERDERTVFTAQHAVAALLALALWAAAPSLAKLYARPAAEAALFRAVALSLLLFPLQTVPIARLERELSFGRIALVEGAQALLFNAVLIALLWSGAGTGAVSVAVVVRAGSGAIFAWLASPWRPGYALVVPRLRALARFGVPFQAVTWLSLVKDSMTPLLIGLTAGAAAVGHVDWAQTVATYPALALMILQRIYVPAFARVQHDAGELTRLTERALQATNAIAAPIAVVTLVLIGPIIDLGFGARWREAQELFYWLWCANLVVPTVTPLVGLLNALGRARAVLGLAVVWTLGTWLLGTPLVLLLGPIGYGVANVLVQGSSFWVVGLARERARFRVLPNVLPGWLAAAAAGLPTLVVARLWPPASLAQLIVLVAAALLLYAVVLAALLPGAARRTWDALRGNA